MEQPSQILFDRKPLNLTAKGFTLGPDDLNGDFLQVLAWELGVGVALQFCSRWGGMRKYIPKDLKRGHLIEPFDEQQSLRLCRLFGPLRNEVPLYPLNRGALLKIIEIRILVGREMDDEVASDLGISSRTVQQLAADIKNKEAAQSKSKKTGLTAKSTAKFIPSFAGVE